MEKYQKVAIVVGLIGIVFGLLWPVDIHSRWLALLIICVSIVGIVVPLANPERHKVVGVVLIILGIFGNLLLIIPAIMAIRFKPKYKPFE